VTDGDATRVVHAGLGAARQGEPFLAGPTLASAFHLAGDPEGVPYTYHRYGNPTWTAYEQALGGLEDAEVVVFPSGMAAVSAVVLDTLAPGDLLIAPADGYPGIRALAREDLEPHGVHVVMVPSDTAAYEAAIRDAAHTSAPAPRAADPGRTIVWVETPSNPALDVVDIAAVAEAARAAGARLAVDNTLATPLGQSPLDLGADLAVYSASKSLTGHSDLLMGSVATRDAQCAQALRGWRTRTGAIAGPVEAWLAHRSLATLEVRLTRQCANALALAQHLAGVAGVSDVRHPGLPGDPAHELAARQMRHFGCLVAFCLPDAARAQRFLGECRLIIEATSFGGVHTTAERRGRWNADDVPEGFIRLSAGLEDPADLIADIGRALDAG
jgi:cystathionine gamma-lyase